MPTSSDTPSASFGYESHRNAQNTILHETRRTTQHAAEAIVSVVTAHTRNSLNTDTHRCESVEVRTTVPRTHM